MKSQIAITALFMTAAGTTAADLEIYTPTTDLTMPVAWFDDWFGNGIEPTEFFDIRLAPEAQYSANPEGSIIFVADARGTTSIPNSGYLNKALNSASNSVSFLSNGTELQGGYGCDSSNYWQYAVPITFQPGDAVGPGSTEIGNSVLFVIRPLYLEPNNDCSNNPPFADIDVVSDGFTIGVSIDEADGTHYGWITLERINTASRVSANEVYRIVQYAYETDPGVPAPVPHDCLADVNGDGMATPADFTAWINAFNSNLPACDQNNDGACTPTDFTAWVNNFNNGC
ncbi:MAG: hypothetical protein Phyf2KO_14940 [Phycisphaerales bacterium]